MKIGETLREQSHVKNSTVTLSTRSLFKMVVIMEESWSWYYMMDRISDKILVQVCNKISDPNIPQIEEMIRNNVRNQITKDVDENT